MTQLQSEIMADEVMEGESSGEARGWTLDGEATARISNPAAENGYPTAGGLSWLNSAAVRADIDGDRVILSISIGDPRGAFTVEVLRTDDNHIRIFLPQPSDGMAHLPTRELLPGVLEIVTSQGGDAPATFDDDETDEDEDGADDE